MQPQSIRSSIGLSLAWACLASTSLLAQAPRPATQVMAILSVKEGVNREAIMKVMPGEVRATVKLYLDGHIQQWFSRADGKGVVFILDAKTVDEAKTYLESLPLIQGRFASFEYTPLSPLMPLRILLGPDGQ